WTSWTLAVCHGYVFQQPVVPEIDQVWPVERWNRHIFEIEPQEVGRFVHYIRIAQIEGDGWIRAVRMHHASLRPRSDGLQGEVHILEIGRIISFIHAAGAGVI